MSVRQAYVRHPRPDLREAEDSYERIIPLPRRAPGRSWSDARVPADQPADDPESFKAQRLRRARSAHAGDWRTWLKRNALSLAITTLVLVLLTATATLAVLALRPTAPGATTAQPSTETALPVPATAPEPAAAVTEPRATERDIRASVQELQSNYTIREGDTLGSIATRFNTTVERIQAFNNLADPRVLNIDQKLIIPPAL